MVAMREIVEFRIPEKYASRLFASHEGKKLGNSVRLVEVATSDSRFAQVGLLQKQMRAGEGEPFFYGWRFRRRYYAKELESAELFHLKITAVFEPAGEECGTVYDDSTTCLHCGANRRQVTDLILDLRRIPKGRDIAKTIADEWIVSQRLAQLLVDYQMTGFELRPIRHKASYQEDPIDPTKLESGQELLQRAKAAGYPYPSWVFWVWFNRPDQARLLHQVIQEYVASQKGSDAKQPPKPLSTWYQLVITSRHVSTTVPTRFGIDPFDEDLEGRYRCPQGHMKGLNLLSELYIARATWDGNDIARTEDLISTRRGLLVPMPMLLTSPRLGQLLQIEKIKSYEVEVAHLV